MKTHLRELGLSDFRRELEFCAPERLWRFDFAIERLGIAIEIEGGIFTEGRHSRGRGYQRDLEKYNTATALGWRVFRFSVEDVLRGREIPILTYVLEAWRDSARAPEWVPVTPGRRLANATRVGWPERPLLARWNLNFRPTERVSSPASFSRKRPRTDSVNLVEAPDQTSMEPRRVRRLP